MVYGWGQVWILEGGQGSPQLTCLLIIFHNEFAFLYYMCNLQR